MIVVTPEPGDRGETGRLIGKAMMFCIFFFRRNKSWLFAIVQKRSLQLVKRRWNDTAAPFIDSVAPSGTYMEGRWHVTGDVMAWWWLGTGRVVFTCVIFVIFESVDFSCCENEIIWGSLILPSPWCYIAFILHRGTETGEFFWSDLETWFVAILWNVCERLGRYFIVVVYFHQLGKSK